MNLLAIDTSTDICCVSLCKDNKLISTYNQRVSFGHTKFLAKFTDDIIKKNNFSVKSLDYIILSIGPGSYSGLRAGSSFSKGLSYAIGKPIIPINTIDLINSLVANKDNYYVALYSHKDYIYYQEFCNGEAIGEQYCDRISKLNEYQFYGYGLEAFPNINSLEVKPSSLNLVNYILKNKDLMKMKNIASISPIYLEKNN
ncbi:MAG: tRNA (adenosine(37)-N6)-threonylcarbamoyltransferase complex dimerization subunit type 1 TsaB [Candidatus Marinimicrobia bacterium]|nr:tRNA (adenosine(37)-N6)-threonylcarbamoyltransferase complex dimerization subunit type 1 TsaB [Candidatus Neomarinimicrobiota bacterium]|tara:strand:- start:5468 stop:6064 length:597 start_codon:yes stop_codon:yes gene_type:complete